MPLDPIEAARAIARGVGEEEDNRESPTDVARRIARGLPPEDDEGLDLLQPVRTFFGASQGIGGKALGYLAPEEYEAATEEMRQGFGIKEGAPWYEDVEALPGVGDVAAQFVEPETRESLLGRAVGPALRMVGNIVGDPTTYVGGFAAKGALGAVKAVKGGAALLKTTREAAKGRQLALKALKKSRPQSAAQYGQRAARENFRDATRISDLVLAEGTPAQLRAYRAGIGLAKGGPLAMGVGAAAAYGPEAAKAAWEGAGRTIEAEGVGEKAAEAANTALMAGLTALMGKGVIDAATATRTYTRHLKDTKQIPETVKTMEEGVVGDVAATAQEPVGPLGGEAPPIFPEGPMPVGPDDAGPIPGPEGPARDIVLPEEGPPMPPPDEGGPIDLPGEAPPLLPEGPLPIVEDAPPLTVPTDVPPIKLPPAAENALLDLGYTPAEMAMLSEDEAARILQNRITPERVDEAVTAPEAGAPVEEGALAPEVGPEPIPGEAPSVPPAEAPALAPDPLQVYADLAGGDLNAALASRGVTRAQFEGLTHNDRVGLFTGKLSADDVVGGEVVEPTVVTPEAPPQVEPTVEPAAPSAEPITPTAPESPVAAPEGPATPEAPVQAPVEPSKAPSVDSETVGGILNDPDFKTLMDSEGRREAAKAAGRGGETLQGGSLVERIINYATGSEGGLPDAPTFLLKEIGDLPGKHGSKERRAAMMALLRRVAKENPIEAAKPGAGGGSIMGEAPLQFATETAEGAGKPTKRTLKEQAGDAGPEKRLALIKSVVEDAGVKWNDFLFKTQTWRRAKKEHKDIWLEYENQRGRGLSRKEAVANTQKKFANSLNPRTIQTLIGRMEGENGILSEALGVEGKEKATEAEIAVLKKNRDALDLPEPAEGQTPDLFTARFADDPDALIQPLMRFLRFAHERTELQKRRGGIPTDVLSNDPLKKLARSMDVDFAPTEDAVTIAARMASKIGLDAAGIRSFARRVEGETTQGARTRPVMGGFKRMRDDWVHEETGLRMKMIDTGEGNHVQIVGHGDDASAIAEAIRPIAEHPDVAAIDISDAKRIKGRNVMQEAVEELGLVDKTPENFDGVLYGRDDPVDTMAARMEDYVRNVAERAINATVDEAEIDAAIDTKDFGIKLRNQLKGKVDGLDLNDLIEAEYKSGRYHNVYTVKGGRTTGDNPNGVVIRVGRVPVHEFPTTAQQALVQPFLAKGKLYDDAKGPMYYTVHPMAENIGFDPFGMQTVPRLDKTGLLTTTDPVLKSLSADDLTKDMAPAVYDRLALEATTQLPSGMTLQDNLDAIASLFTRAERAGLVADDLTHGPGKVRFDQMGWVPVEKVTPDMVTFKDAAGQNWRMVFTDYGTVFPNPETRAGSVWEYYDRGNDPTMVSLKETLPESNLSLRDQQERVRHYEQDFVAADDMGDGLVNVNNDRIAPQEFVDRHSALGRGAALQLRDIVQDLMEKINARDDVKPYKNPLDVEYSGLTSSPRLSGLHIAEPMTPHGRILTNLVEAANAGKNYDEAIDKTLYTLLHEVTHNKNRGHEGSFQTIENYIRNLADAEGSMDQYRAMLKKGLTPEDYNGLVTDLVPQFRKLRDEYGGRESWRQASIERLSAGSPESRTATRADRSGRGAQAPARGLVDGVQPGEPVQRGGGRQARGVREAPGVDGAAAARRAEVEATRSRLGRGTEEASREYQRIVGEVDTLFGEGLTQAEAQAEAVKLLDELVEATPKDKPLRDVFTTAWELAGRWHQKLPQSERDELRKTLPAPRKKGQSEGVINMLHNPEISDAIKERTALYGKITKASKAWKRDKVRKWDEVGDEVHELLGMDTPEAWTMAFRNKGGGLKDRDVLLLRQVHTDLAQKVERQETRLADAISKGDEALTTQVGKDLQTATRTYLHAGLNLANGLTGVARALAIGRKTIRSLDPQMAWQADLKAGLRERMRTKFKDPIEAEGKANALFDQMMEIVETDGDWGEFYKAYRTMMGSRLWPDKVLEWYKAGLLGWPSRVANISSNALFRGVRYVEDAVAGGLDFSKSKLTGSKRDVYAGEVGASMLALRRANAEAFPKWTKEFGRSLRLEAQDFTKAVQRGSIMEDMLMHPGAIEGKFGEFVRFQLKGLGADDEYYKTLSRYDTYYREVYRRIRKGEFRVEKGESHVQATERIATDLRENFKAAMEGRPYDAGKLKMFQPIAEEADKIAKRDTFQEDLGDAGRGFQSLLRKNPALQVFFPFVRTPTNIAKETIARTPLGFITLARKWKDLTPEQRLVEISKPITGTAMGAGIMGLAMTGEITGGGPVDFNEKQAMIQAGWAPYSVRIGDQWISFQRFEPIAAVLGTAADAAEGVRNGDFDSWETGTMKVLQSFAENITNKTFMSGMDALFSALSDPKRSLGRFTKQMQGSVIPNSLGFVPVGHLARAIDGTFRQTEPMTMDAFYNKVPFLSRTLTPQYTPTGEERERPGSAFERLVSPIARRTVEDGPAAAAAEEVVRIGAVPQPPKKYWYGKGGVRVPFEAEEKQLFAKALAQATQAIGTKVLRDPSFLRLPDNEEDPRYRYGTKTKQEVLRRVYQKYRTAAMKQIRPKVEARARKSVRDARS